MFYFFILFVIHSRFMHCVSSIVLFLRINIFFYLCVTRQTRATIESKHFWLKYVLIDRAPETKIVGISLFFFAICFSVQSSPSGSTFSFLLNQSLGETQSSLCDQLCFLGRIGMLCFSCQYEDMVFHCIRFIFERGIVSPCRSF